MRPFSGEAVHRREPLGVKKTLDDLDDPLGVPDAAIEAPPAVSSPSFGMQEPEVPTAHPIHSGIRAHEERIVEPTKRSATLEALVRKARGYAAVEFEEVPIDENSREIFDMAHQAINKTLEPKEFIKLSTEGIPRGLIQMLNLFHRRGAYLMRLLPKDDPRYGEYGTEQKRMEAKIRDVAARPEFAALRNQKPFNDAVSEFIELVKDPFMCNTLLMLCEMRDRPRREDEDPNEYGMGKIKEMVSLLT